MDESWLKLALKLGARYADLRHQILSVHSLEARNGKIERAFAGIEEGVGLSVLVGNGWGFFSTNRVDPAGFGHGVEQAVGMARAASKHVRDKQGLSKTEPRQERVHWIPKEKPVDVPIEDKKEIVATMHKAVREFPQVKSTSGTYADRTITQTFISSEGARVETQLTRSVAQVHFVAKESGRITSRRVRVGATKGFELFRETDVAKKSREAAAATVRMLKAASAPSGRMTVVTDPELTGVFTHEAVGHASEGDLVAAGESCLRGRIGERLANVPITVMDDSTVPGGFGSFPYDDHGLKSAPRLVIERGVLKAHLTDRSAAFRLKLPATASARAESYAVKPLVRMTNTFITAGDLSFEEVLEGIGDGVYAVGSRGGQVDTAKGTFQFSAQEAYRIRKGEVAEPLRDVSLTGFTLETLKNIDGVGKEFAWGDPGYCGKGQWVPVGDGGPHLRIQNTIVGGQH